MVKRYVPVSDKVVQAIAMSPQMRKYLLRVARAGARGAKRRCPVDTGALRRSIKAEVKDGVATWGSDLDYAQFVEFGTMRMRAQPYLRPSIDDAKTEARRG